MYTQLARLASFRTVLCVCDGEMAVQLHNTWKVGKYMQLISGELKNTLTFIYCTLTVSISSFFLVCGILLM